MPWVILVPCGEAKSLTKKGLERKMNSVLHKLNLYDIHMEIVISTWSSRQRFGAISRNF